MPTKNERYFVNSSLIRDFKQNRDTVLVSEKIAQVDEEGKRKWASNLRVIDNPKRNYYITKKEFQTYDLPREFETLERLDCYNVPNFKLREDLWRRLNGNPDYTPRFLPSLKDLCNSPYVYGADISIESLIKRKYRELGDPNVDIPLTHGTEDIETDVSGNGDICVHCLICEKNIYAVGVDSYSYEGKGSERRRVTREYIDSVIHNAVDEMFDLYGAAFKHSILKHRPDLFREGTDHIDFKITTILAKDEKELLKITREIREKDKVDFAAIWNIDYDIPYICERLEYHDIDVNKYWTADEILQTRPELAKARYRRDNATSKQKSHPGDKWHVFDIANSIRFYCAMATFARVRKASGRPAALTLDYTAKSQLGVGKFSFGKFRGDNPYPDVYTINYTGERKFLAKGEHIASGKYCYANGKSPNSSYSIMLPLVDRETGAVVISEDDILQGLYDSKDERLVVDVDDHYIMQQYRYPEYVAYCVVDCILPQLMAWANSDHKTVLSLLENSLWSDFDKQGTMLRNNFYSEWMDEGKVVKSVGSDGIRGNFDKYIKKAGGTVLRSEDVTNIGLKCNPFISTLETLLNIFVNDLDAGSMYPTMIEIMNISRETKIATAIHIPIVLSAQGDPIEYVYNCVASPEENSGLLMAEALNLPSYEEMYNGFMSHMEEREAPLT